MGFNSRIKNLPGGVVQLSASTALFQGDIRVLGTASISQLNTINQTSLLVGDKYITILSGGVDHTGIDGAGILWGTSSGPGETTGALGEHAHLLYDASRDALKIFPGLYVSGSTELGISKINGDLLITGSARRIRGDFSDVNQANRVIFQTNVTNGNTSIPIAPNGTATISTIWVANNSDVVNASYGQLVATPTEIILRSECLGTGSMLPLKFYTSGSERMRIESNGNVGIAQTSPAAKLDVNGASVGNITAVAALNIDCSLGNSFTKTINGASTFTVSNVPASRDYAFTLELEHTSGAITWFSGVEWPGGSAPTLTTGKTHIFIFQTDNGGTRWRASSLINYTT